MKINLLTLTMALGLCSFAFAAGAEDLDVKGSCPNALMENCQEFIGNAWNQLPELRCGAGLASRTPCSRTNVLGRCLFLEAAGDFDTAQYYYEGQFYQRDDIEMLRSACEGGANGVFEEL